MGNNLVNSNNENKPAKHPGGRPPKYKTPEEMQEEIDWYFKECRDGIVSTDEFGEIVYNKDGTPSRTGQKPPTVTGLARALGFGSRQALIEYEGRDDFVNTIRQAKMIIEEYAEARLFDRDGVQGAKFSLANNFKGWKEDRSLDITVNAGQQQVGEITTLRDLEKKKASASNQEITGDIVDIEKDD